MNKLLSLLLICSCTFVASAKEKKIQNATLTSENQEYVLTPSTLIKGIPVRMKVELKSVRGCMRAIVIESFGVKKTVMKGDNTIEFTPTKTGNIEVVCGMGMNRGFFKVIEAAELKK